MIRTAKAIERKIKIRSISVEHLRFKGVHDAAHANIEVGASQQGHLILAVHASITHCRVPCFGTKLAEQEDQEVCPQQFGCGGKSYVHLSGASRLDAHNVGANDQQCICAREL